MTLKILKHKDGRTFKMGRRPPLARGPRLSLRNYLGADLPNPPHSIDYAKHGGPSLRQVLLNDHLGDCTAAGVFHIQGLLEGNRGFQHTWTDHAVERFYSWTTGYNPRDPSTDQGGDEVTVLNFWKQHGLLADGSHKIAGYVAVNPSNIQEIQTAMWLFENLYFGVAMPDEWIEPFPDGDGFIWDISGEPNPNNGHCFVGIGYDLTGVTIDTWGMFGKLTYRAISNYVRSNEGGELWSIVSHDAIDKATGKAPNGFDESQLLADLQAISVR